MRPAPKKWTWHEPCLRRTLRIDAASARSLPGPRDGDHRRYLRESVYRTSIIPDEVGLIRRIYYVTQRLYYVPVIYAGFHFGWRGGLSAALFASLVYLPQIAGIWRLHPRYTINQYIEVLLFCVVGVLTGILADRERARKRSYPGNRF